ncbi:hypothetical protein QWZ17_25565 [Mucilaginibacter flavus]|nr:hypothetical protein [Mucilaginibacter flavus]
MEDVHVLKLLREHREKRQFDFIKRLLTAGEIEKTFILRDEKLVDSLIWILISTMRVITVDYCSGRLICDVEDIPTMLCAMLTPYLVKPAPTNEFLN